MRLTLPNHRRNSLWAMATAVVCGWMALPARADIYEWTTGTDGSIVQSSTVCPGGRGVNAVPYAYFGYLNLTQAYLVGANLTNSTLGSVTLTNADLTNANMWSTNLANADLAHADLAHADLDSSMLGYANLANANLTNAELFGATVTAPISRTPRWPEPILAIPPSHPHSSIAPPATKPAASRASDWGITT